MYGKYIVVLLLNAFAVVLLQTAVPGPSSHCPYAHEKEKEEGDEAQHLQHQTDELGDVVARPLRTFLHI
jgi:hypothetical protein